VSALVLLAVLLPGLFWNKDPETASALKQAGIERLYVPAEKAAAWRAAGFNAVALGAATLSGLEKVDAPRVEWKMDVASATRAPWIDANGWRFTRQPGRRWYEEPPNGAGALAAAEAFAYDADAILRIAPGDLPAFGRMLEFLKRADQAPMPALANIGLIDDGSDLVAEVMNLLARKNLLYRIVPAPEPSLDLNVRIGSREFPRQAAEDPGAFASLVRQRLTDDKRLLRIYGSDVVIGRLTGQGPRARLHLLNYAGREVQGLRVRLRGRYKGTLRAAGIERAALEDSLLTREATEFSIPAMMAYAIVDLEALP